MREHKPARVPPLLTAAEWIGRWTSISFHVLGLAFVQAFTVLVFIFLAGIVTGVLS